MIVKIGSKEYGYQCLISEHQRFVERYITHVAPRYDEEIAEKNVVIVRRVLSYNKLITPASLITTMLLGADIILPSFSFAAAINTGPLDELFKTVYWTMFKIMMYISTPVWAWAGYNFAFGGANSEKRTVAKRILASLVIGTGVAASAPWATNQLFALWRALF